MARILVSDLMANTIPGINLTGKWLFLNTVATFNGVENTTTWALNYDDIMYTGITQQNLIDNINTALLENYTAQLSEFPTEVVQVEVVDGYLQYVNRPSAIRAENYGWLNFGVYFGDNYFNMKSLIDEDIQTDVSSWTCSINPKNTIKLINVQMTDSINIYSLNPDNRLYSGTFQTINDDPVAFMAAFPPMGYEVTILQNSESIFEMEITALNTDQECYRMAIHLWGNAVIDDSVGDYIQATLKHGAFTVAKLIIEAPYVIGKFINNANKNRRIFLVPRGVDSKITSLNTSSPIVLEQLDGSYAFCLTPKTIASLNNCKLGKVGMCFPNDFPYGENKPGGAGWNWELWINGVNSNQLLNWDNGYVEDVIYGATNGKVQGKYNTGLFMWNNSTEQVILEAKATTPINQVELEDYLINEVSDVFMDEHLLGGVLVGINSNTLGDAASWAEYYNPETKTISICLAPYRVGGPPIELTFTRNSNGSWLVEAINLEPNSTFNMTVFVPDVIDDTITITSDQQGIATHTIFVLPNDGPFDVKINDQSFPPNQLAYALLEPPIEHGNTLPTFSDPVSDGNGGINLDVIGGTRDYTSVQVYISQTPIQIIDFFKDNPTQVGTMTALDNSINVPSIPSGTTYVGLVVSYSQANSTKYALLKTFNQ